MPVKPFEFLLNLQKALPQLEAEIANIVVRTEANNFVAKNFRDEGFNGTGLKKWPKRKNDRDPGRALLVGSRSSKTDGSSLRLKPAAVKFRAEGEFVRLTIPLVYASVHNNGERSDIPQRQFVGESQYLNDRIEKKSRQLLDQKLKDLAS